MLLTSIETGSNPFADTSAFQPIVLFLVALELVKFYTSRLATDPTTNIKWLAR